MKRTLFLLLIIFPVWVFSQDGEARTQIELNGTWQFDQTTDAFPPKVFTRTIPVPGLVHLANPKIEEYDKFFNHQKKVGMEEQHRVHEIDYTPRYSWYKRKVFIPKKLEGKEGMITIKKSKYVTQVYLNGMDLGTSNSCYTPIEFPINKAVKYGQENELMIKVGDRFWLPTEAAGGTDIEKVHYLPGIWDDVFLSFTGKLRLNRILPLPSVKGRKATVKMQVINSFPAWMLLGDSKEDTCTVNVAVYDNKSGKQLGGVSEKMVFRRDYITECEVEVNLEEFPLWTPAQPNLCRAEVELVGNGLVSDKVVRKFGMRDFTAKGKFFYLNGEKTILRGSNICLHRFFEDPDCAALVWDKEWVREFMVGIPKKLNWNTMRISLGTPPDFWFDIADENGLMFQNEWMYWKNHGWPDQIREEFTDWVWTDGSHPSIVIWDAINEDYNEYVGNTLIPELKKLDPTRIWDAGHMTGEHMALNEMDEPHHHEGPLPWKDLKAFYKNPYPMGDLDYRNDRNIGSIESGAPQLVNEYGGIWLFRNGNPAKLTVDLCKYYLGEGSTPEQNREFQAYKLQLDTEWLRSKPYHAGVLSFSYLSNNYGYTGDWFIDNIKDLVPGPTLYWFKHAYAPQAVFINLVDGRYMKPHKAYAPGSTLSFNLLGVNDIHTMATGDLELLLYDENGQTEQLATMKVNTPAFSNQNIPVSIRLPAKTGGYLLIANFRSDDGEFTMSRRYIKVGKEVTYSFYEIEPKSF